MLREDITQLDAILFTHDHKDHTGGLDDVRAFNFLQKKHMEVYAEENVLNTIKKEFSYAFAEKRYPGVPRISLNKITNAKFKIDDIEIEPIRGIHLKLPVLGFKIDKLAYITDMNYISGEELQKIKNIDTLVINALRHEKHVSHFNLEEALDIINKVKPKKAYLTHISHALGKYSELNTNLPKNVSMAYDGLKIEI
jgi:phosphoribosyl 1,2-cyclic phosphate phosphodiesterase